MIGLLDAKDAFDQAFLMNVNDLSNQYITDAATYVTAARTIVPPSTPEFEAVKEDVRQALKMRDEGQAAQEFVNAVKERIESGESTLEAEARKAGSVIETPPAAVTRMNAETSGLPNTAIGGIFSGKAGEVFTYPNRTGDKYMVVLLQSVNNPSAEDLEAASATAFSALQTTVETDLSTALEAEMAKAVKLKVNNAAFNAYKTSITSEQ